MSKSPSLLSAIVTALLGLLGSKNTRSRGSSAPKPTFRTPLGSSAPERGRQTPRSTANQHDGGDGAEAGRFGKTATLEVDPRKVRVTVSYSPSLDGAPDAGEIIWTWVPYEENDGRGKDRPVLVIGSVDAERFYAVRLTSKAHDGQRDYLSIGSGPWDSKGRESWVDIDQLYTVHLAGMRREAAILDKARFLVVAKALKDRWGW